MTQTQAVEDKFISMARQMGKWVDQVLGPQYHQFCPADAWNPAVNIYETQGQYCIVMDLAGVKGEEIDVRVESGVLVISGERAVPGLSECSEPVRMHLMEIDHGRFCRTLEVPENVDVKGFKAVYGNGYLWVKMPKKS